MRYLYSALFYCILPIVVLRMLWRSRGAPEYRRRLSERFGKLPVELRLDGRPLLWLHAVSVGETLAAAPVIEALLSRYPGYQLLVTTTTPTGSERVYSLFGERVLHVYAPWDIPGAVGRFMRVLKPSLLVIMETELWPNMLHAAQRAGCPVVLANARMSERSARGYARLGSLTREMLGHLDTVACQGQADGERFLQLGLPHSALQFTGSIKFDLELDTELRSAAAALRNELGAQERPVVVAASTHPGEDEQILAAFARLKTRFDDGLLVLVPRHPERFDAVGAMCADAGWRVVRRTSGQQVQLQDDILLGDTMGELLLLLSAANIAIIGGSLVEHGGHNVLEASAWGVPVVTGPHMFNFAEISELLCAAGAMLKLDRADALANELVALMADAERQRRMGEAGQRVVAENRGARSRLLELIDDLIVA